MSDPAGIPTRTIAMLTDTWRAVSELGADLSETEWKQPSELPGWTIQDLLSHLIGTERMLEGLPAAPPCADPGGHVLNAIGGFNENEVEARRGLTGADVLAEWNELCVQRTSTFEAADAAYFAQPKMTPTGPGTMADFLDIRILDCWVHEQDMRRVLGVPGNLGGPAAEHTVDRLIRTIPIVIGKRAACPEGGAVAIRITGAVERDLTCEVRNGRAGFVAQPSSPAVCSIEMDTSAFIMLATGRQEPAAVDDLVVIAADDPSGLELARRAIGHFNMMI